MAQLNVSKKTVKDILDRQGYVYVIPQYQRPYSWDVEKCNTLWTDIREFFDEIREEEYSEKFYYLGCIVSIEGGKRRIEIVDGQQRITSLLLLLRAIYTHISSMPGSTSVTGQQRLLERCIWNVDPVTQQVDNKNIRIETQAQNAGTESFLSDILSSGDAPNPASKKGNNYVNNYKFFLNQYKSFVESEPEYWCRLVNVILNNCVFIPIECGNIDEALKIFNTLNTRGQPLSDADIFKSNLFGVYRERSNEEEFRTQWDSLNTISQNAGLKVDDVFRYYAYKLICEKIREKNDGRTATDDQVLTLSKEVELRKFYMDSSAHRLAQPDLMENLISLAKFWEAINDDADDYDTTYVTPESKRLLHCLSQYPNINWRRVVSVFYFAFNKDADSIRAHLPSFLKRLLSYLCVRFINKPGVDAIRQGIAKACQEMIDTNSISQTCREDISALSFAKKLRPDEFVAERLTKTLILLNAYLCDEQGTSLIPKNFNVEHILPVKWQAANYQGWSRQKAETEGWLESLGNKIPFEKKLNIQAGNGYFAEKKKKYIHSEIAEVKALAEHEQEDWQKKDVEARLEEMAGRLCNFFMKNLS